MPPLRKQGVKPLLKIVRNTPRDGVQQRKPASDIDPNASPISLSDASSEADLEPELNHRPAKRARVSDIQDDLRNPRKTQWKGHGKSEPSNQPGAVVISSQDDEKLAAFDEMHSSQSKMQKRILYHRNLNMKTQNIHLAAEDKKKEKAQKKQKAGKALKETDISNAKVPPKASFKLPGDIFEPVSPGEVKGFNAPPSKSIRHTRNTRNEKTTFQTPHDVKAPMPSSAPVSLRLPSSANSSPCLSPAPASSLPVTATEPELKYSMSLDSPSSSPGPFIGTLEEARCPMCKAEVDRELLESFSVHKKLRLKEAMDFCIAHKAQNAQSSWADSKYPTVNWDLFDKRLKRFSHRIRAILAQREESFFRNELAAKVASGQNRNALRNPEADRERGLRALTGYYGPKGARKMMEHITNNFAEKIRKVATEDELFTEVGVGGFIQAVLVPELAVSLIMEDYGGCDEDRAREILTDSTEMGDLVHAEEDERVEEKTEKPNGLTELGAVGPKKSKTNKKSRGKVRR